MGANVVTAWEQALRLLHDCNPGSSRRSAAADSLSQLLDKLQQLPAPPKAAWKKLVQQLKVRLASQASALPAHVPYPHQRCVGHAPAPPRQAA